MFATAQIIAIFSDFCYFEIKPEMRDVVAKMRECGREAKMRDFPHDCGTVDTYVILLNQIPYKVKKLDVPRFGIRVVFFLGQIPYNVNVRGLPGFFLGQIPYNVNVRGLPGFFLGEIPYNVNVRGLPGFFLGQIPYNVNARGLLVFVIKVVFLLRQVWSAAPATTELYHNFTKP